MFEAELAYFIANQESLVASYCGKTLALQGASVIGVYDSALEAYLDLERTGTCGSAMIQRCEAGPDAYTVTIASDVIWGLS